MMRLADRLLLVAIIIVLFGVNSGCVRRIVTIDSQPQGAEVYFNHKLIGETPCRQEFLYYGGYHLELVRDGYANFNTTLKLKGPIYEYFPLSILSELLIPWEITDKHSFTFQLEKGQVKKPVIYPIEQPQPPLSAPELKRIER